MKTNLFSTIILAAGSGTRMHAALPKVLHRIGGQSMIAHLVETLKKLHCRNTCLVTAPGMERVRDSFPALDHAIQDHPLGTAHAVLAAEKEISSYKTDILILYGDVPLITEQTLQRIIKKGQDHDVVMLGMQVQEENAYGRVLVNASGQVEEVVEAVDCTPEQRKVTLCSSGIFLIRHKVVLPLLKKIGNKNQQKEFYLPDIVKIARQEGYSVVVEEGALSELQGINTQGELARAEKTFQTRKRKEFLEKGVTLLDPDSVYFSYDTEITPDVLIEPNVFMGPGVTLEAGVEIKAFSHLEGAHVRQGAVVGPFARLRPGTVVGKKCKVGNFVEIKKSILGTEAKVSHLTYIGDAELGNRVNIGAGTITCNYDGYSKHKTVIKDGVFVGSNTALVAPITLGKDAMIGAGSVITDDVPAGDIALSRAPQKNIRGASTKFRSKHSKK
ncbi:MAG: UDP-N-acetylglucosamine diphosphorylase/glucosamine-1-phosphate N-acetyltransferase [Alphaproteobacteria bacterium RIFCSPLOWO2_01_FULL_45_8]|nr:MAG: UDP-N-acetylglucosamine diphosphorylase/glucosamine-1-phosphate N-acetyltransferase [Alphaproteobacteria bacterium GWA1_45_9]OFW89959.1 MAG: UDP-N-acetylglucosamine diphosphorylase/glucosamine-1-phosphate N-acetyltransferase [Alphaproteobacteria bacterium RIFCSPHIGHO2_01_FULL_41_14]OFW96650.1 MAG: UDP-N-acetylglucosamine diphosphorylase/glucosamine-1-phosphate N-acetyltransferase [Alphaproteobacteria bacterium RIFCSPLOWO2_01_FULL_45_8]HCI48895.1 bifunctional UDP-N-acetylglucosamine dipho